MTDNSQPPAAAAGLVVSVDTRRIVVPPDRPVVLGRDPAAGLRLEDPAVSRRHAELSCAQGVWTLRDLGSSNGTYVDGRRVDTVAVRGRMLVRLGGAAEDGVPVLLEEPAPVPPPVPVAEPTAAVRTAAVPAVPAQRVAPPAEDPATSPVAYRPGQRRTPPGAPGAGTGTPTAPVPVAPVRATTASHPAAGRVLRIGRAQDNDIVLADLDVSRHHAEVRPTGGGYEVVDAGSRHGTYHNGRQVTRADLHPGDMVAIGRHQFAFDGSRLHQSVDTGPLSLTADDITVRIGDAVLLDDISFALPKATLLAVIGPSGCGKSTLLRAMTGLRPATLGAVRYDGRDLYANFAELRYRIGLVPQDDVLHRQLTVRRALRFAASLRFADDVPRRQRWARVDEVLNLLGLTARGGQRIDTLSGGQRKRTSVALELLTEPSLLFLDEPTSGLDPALDKEVMTQLRQIADNGRTVVVVTHSVLHLDLCDRVLVMCAGGTMGYFGPPDGLLGFFGAQDYAQVFTGITDEPALWTRRYRGSELYRRYVLDVMQVADAQAAALAATPAPVAGTARPPAAPSTPDTAGPAPSTVESSAAQPPVRPRLDRIPLRRRALHPGAALRQFVTLCTRMLAIIAADRGYALFLLALPLALALITHTVPGHDGLAPPSTPFGQEAQRLLVVLVVGAAFLGIATAIREIVNESTIYRRERAVGLSPAAYLGSKVAVFAVINTLQVVLFVYLALLGRGRPATALVVHPPLAEIMVAVALVALASSALGLLISSLVRTLEQTTPVLVVLVMGQLVVSGGLFELNGRPVLEQIAWLAPTRWGFAAGAGTVDLQSMTRVVDPLWAHTASSWWRAALLLGVQTVVLVLAARVALRRQEPGRS